MASLQTDLLSREILERRQLQLAPFFFASLHIVSDDEIYLTLQDFLVFFVQGGRDFNPSFASAA
ncbi:hypothetical protein XaplCFBP3123_18720 [Xanthomonas arboricola pv. populi]|nr:hypothetical protein XaplCFBP3123_18720 [Xanthomonas arboricola pv. populi]